MKQYIYFLIISLSLFSVGCSTASKTLDIKSNQCLIDNNAAPKWVCGLTPDNEGFLYEVGSSKIIKGNVNLARSIAFNNAREALASDIQTYIETSTFDNTIVFSKNNKDSSESSLRKVLKSVSSENLLGTKQEATWITRDHIFILISMSKDLIKRTDPRELKERIRGIK